ncbi:MAG TPA: 1,6-anhydro-N-acetylmuramyl-L-alanine amidase AmpD [Gammaproteobacteria bacterium]|jgi:AmpD protein|nr:1,6-anhydro-N-acetylmuramyl-L-alanine amidase AmpD [Gammaproteobacteria bacterium]
MQYEVDLVTGLLSGTAYRPSPHCDARPAGMAVDLLVIHGISLPPGEFGGPWIEQLFLGQLPPDAHSYFKDIAGLRVASHLLIRRDGEVVQFVPFHMRAWHAGASRFQDREACNDFSIGIEIEGDDTTPYAGPQYSSLACVSAALMRAYPGITTSRIVGHSDIAPGRKTDPGPAFDWMRYRDILASQPRAGSTTQP